ncbi:MAG TPA: hypothetical protein VJU59_11240 [Paraburkholderia sp.]|nr:hypothetical protein [Paraburkholderia sp.]HKR40233.1 hypothetical protein [Paraburkholderia sp.]
MCDRRVGLAQYEDSRVVQSDITVLRVKTALAPDMSINRDEASIAGR